MGFLHQFLDQFDTGKHDPLASAGHVGKQTMLNRVVLGAIGWVMGNANFKTDLVGQGLQVLFEYEMAGVIAAAAIALDQDRSRTGIAGAAISVPPVPHAITRKFTGIVAGADLNVTDRQFWESYLILVTKLVWILRIDVDESLAGEWGIGRLASLT
jgi:hypothetical protein